MDINSIFAVLDQRLEVLQRLSASLAAGATGTPEASVSFLELNTCTQRELLTDWARVEARLESWRRQSPSLFSGDAASRGLPADSETRWLQHCEQYRCLLGEVQQKCRVQVAVLRRARRTAAAFSSFLSGAGPTYAPPLQANTVLIGGKTVGSTTGSGSAGNFFAMGK